MERRKYPRAPVAVEVALAGLEDDGCQGVVTDLSVQGAYLELVQRRPVPAGHAVVLKFCIWTGYENISRQIRARVVRAETAGLALEFTEQDLVASAVVEDLLHYLRRSSGAAVRPVATDC